MAFMDGLKKGLKEGVAKQLAKKAEMGDVSAMVNLGSMYLKGEEIEQNLDEGFRFTKMAADKGTPLAINNLGVCYENGWGVVKNLDAALTCYQKAGAAGYAAGLKNAERLEEILDEDPVRDLLPKAEAGDTEAQTELGYRFAKGIDVEQNFQQAIKWLTPAAQASHLEAQFYLGRLYADDMNLPSEGISWLEKSAEGGYAHAQSKLGIIYATGKHVGKDLDKAAELMRQAALQGNKDAANNLAIVEKQIAAQKKQAETPPPQPTQQAANVTSAPTGKACTQCGAALQDGAKFCGGCGVKVEQAQFCTDCGAKITADSKFCGECGTAAGDSPTPTSQEQPSIVQPVVPEVDFANDLESAYDFANKAEELIKEGETNIARSHVLRGLELVEDVSDLVRLATVACNSDEEEGLGDKEWGRQLFQQAIEKAESYYDFRNIAEEVGKEHLLGDTELSKSLFALSEEKAESSSDYRYLAVSVVAEPLADKEWAVKLFKKAEEFEEDAGGIARIAADVLSGIEDESWARRLYIKAVEMADNSEYQLLAEIAAELNDDLNDQDWASKVISRSIELALQETEPECAESLEVLARDFCRGPFLNKDTARALLERSVELTTEEYFNADLLWIIGDDEYLGDKEWALELCDRFEESFDDSCVHEVIAERRAELTGEPVGCDEDEGSDDDEYPESANDLCYKAEEILYDGGDTEKVRSLIEQGLEIAQDTSDFVRMATIISHSDAQYGLGDKEWGRQVFEKALNKAEEHWDIRGVAESVHQEDLLNDKEWASSLYEQIIASAHDADQLLDTADSIRDCLEDKEWAIRLYRQTEAANPSFADLERLAKTALVLDDKGWAKTLIKKAFNAASCVSDLNSLALCVLQDYEDKAAGLQLMAKAVAMADDVWSLVSCAQDYGYRFEDKDSARAVYEKAVALAKSADNYITIAKSMIDEDYLGDKEWAKQLLDQAEELIDQTEFKGTDNWELTQIQEIRNEIGFDSYQYVLEFTYDIGGMSDGFEDFLENNGSSEDEYYDLADDQKWPVVEAFIKEKQITFKELMNEYSDQLEVQGDVIEKVYVEKETDLIGACYVFKSSLGLRTLDETFTEMSQGYNKINVCDFTSNLFMAYSEGEWDTGMLNADEEYFNYYLEFMDKRKALFSN